MKKSNRLTLLIEATGVANPIDIYSACNDPEIKSSINKVITIGILDAHRFLNKENYSLSVNHLMEEQIKYSNNLIINKIDLINEAELDQLKNEIDHINPHAQGFYTTYGQCNIELLNFNSSNHFTTSNHNHVHGINSISYTFSGPIDRSVFYNFILKLPNNVLRLKGFISFKDQPNAIYEFHYASGLSSYGVIEKDVPLTIVIIGERIDNNRLLNQLEMMQFT